jgi:glucokinase
MSKDALYLGVDFGGTKTLAAVVDERGGVGARCKVATPRKGGAKASLAAVLEAMDGALAQSPGARDRLAGVGMAAPGTVNPVTGCIGWAPNTNLMNIDLVPLLEKKYGVPATVGNDVNMGTLGECWLGAGRGARYVVGIFPGTGVGGGVVLNGALYEGYAAMAGEVGHIIVRMDGPLCGCGGRGCVEAIASRTAVERAVREAVKAGRATRLTEWLGGDLSVIKSSLLKRALEEKDELVTEVLRDAARTLGVACLNVRHVLDPALIIMGGGMIEACGDFMMPLIREVAAADTVKGIRAPGKIVRSELGDDAVLLGAVAAVRAKLGAPAAAPATGGGEPVYPVIESTEFGCVTVAGEKIEADIHVRGNGKLKKRNKKKIKEELGDAHLVGVKEARKLCKGDPALLVIGAGQGRSLKLTPEAEQLLKERGVEVKTLPSPQALKAFNAAAGRKALVLHVTC